MKTPVDDQPQDTAEAPSNQPAQIDTDRKLRLTLLAQILIKSPTYQQNR